MADPTANNVPALRRFDGGVRSASQFVQHVKYKGKLTWTIPDFLAWSEYQDDNFIYNSSEYKLQFENLTLTFQLQLKFNNKTDDKLGFNLVNLNSEDLNIDHTLMVIDSSGAVFKSARGCCKIRKNTGSRGFYLSKKNLRDKPEHLLGGSLQMKCKLIIYKAAVSTSVEVDDSDTGDDSDPGDYIPYLNEDIEKLWSEEFATDFNLRCGEELFPCHKFILASRSTVFKAMFGNNAFAENAANEANIRDSSPKTVKDFLVFLYTDELDKADLNSVELLLMADKYNVVGLKINCEKALSKTVDTSNAIKLFCTASTIKAPFLTKNTAKFIFKNIDELFDTAEWKMMVKSNPEHLNSIFKYRRF